VEDSRCLYHVVSAAPSLLATNKTPNRYHQQYLADTKNPYGYGPDHGTGVSCPVGVAKADG
jgi:hypothetical protein